MWKYCMYKITYKMILYSLKDNDKMNFDLSTIQV